MKIIFLDIDGVLNNEVWYKSERFRHGQSKEEYDLSQFDPRCVELLNSLIADTQAKIVVSSSWRLGRTVDELKDLFQRVGILGEVIDKTPQLFFAIKGYDKSVPRGCEIKAWLENNKSIIGSKMSKVNYVILDDDGDMLWWQREHFVQTDPYMGITKRIIFKAKMVLNKYDSI